MYEPETNISEEDLELYADYAVEHAAEIAKIIEQAVETNKVRFKEYLIFMIWCDLDDDTDKVTIYDQYYDKESDKLGEMHEDHTATYDEVTVKDFLDFPDMSQRLITINTVCVIIIIQNTFHINCTIIHINIFLRILKNILRMFSTFK